MNTFQRISQELIVEDLKVHGDTKSAAISDPVARLFMWQRQHSEEADDESSSKEAARGGTKHKTQN